MATGSGSLQAQNSIVAGISENVITAGSATVAALVPEPNGTTVTYDGNTNLIISGINATLNGTYAYLPNVGFTRYSTGNNVYAEYNEDYAVFYNDDEANPRAVVFVSTPGTTKWLVSVYNTSATTWSDDDLIGTKNQTGSFLNVNSVSAERPESGESSSTEELFSGPSYVTGTAERKIDPVDVNLVSGEVGVATVGGSVERQIDAELTTVDAQVSSTTGVSERVVVVANGDLTADEIGVSVVGGAVERQIDGELTAADAQASVVGGVVERQIDGEVTAADAQVSGVFGLGERKVKVVDINLDGIAAEIQAQDATVAGVVERTVKPLRQKIAPTSVMYEENVPTRKFPGAINDVQWIDSENQFVAVTGGGSANPAAPNGIILVSDDGENWNRTVGNLPGLSQEFHYHDGHYLAVTGPSSVHGLHVWWSKDSAQTWSSFQFDSASGLRDINDSYSHYQSGGGSPYFEDAHYHNGKWIIAGAHGLYAEADSVSGPWNLVAAVDNPISPRAHIINMVDGNGKLVIFGATHAKYTTDHETYTNITLPFTVDNSSDPSVRRLVSSADFLNGLFVMVDTQGDTYTSSDAINWTQKANIPGGYTVNSVEYGLLDSAPAFVAVGEAGYLSISYGDNISSWRTERLPYSMHEGKPLRAVAYSPTLQRWVVGTKKNQILYYDQSTNDNFSVELSPEIAYTTGQASRHNDASGSLTSGSSSIDGVSENTIVASGTLQAQASDVGGNSDREMGWEIPDGDDFPPLSAGSSSVSGVAEREVATSTGNVNVGLSSVSATGTVGRHASGTPQAQASSVSGTAPITSNASGSLSDSSSQVTGASEREVTSTGVLSDGSSTVTGITEREVVSVEADLSADEIGIAAVTGVGERVVVTASGISQVSSSTVSGVSERQVDATGALQDQASAVTGVAENTVNASGTLTDGDATVSGVSERSITGSGTLADDASTVDGLAENEVVAGSVALTIGLSSVSATVEITSNGSGVLADDAVTVAGVAERQIDATGANDTGTVTVAGVSERQIDVTGAMDTGESSVTSVTEITANGSGAPQAQSSTTVGVSERTITGSGTLVSQEETVAGLVERVVQPDNIVLQCLTVPSEVTGVAERIVEDDIGAGTDHDLNASAVQVSGVSERTIVGVDTSIQIHHGALIVGAAEREVETNEITQAVQAGSSSTGIADGLPHNAVPGATIRKTGDQAQPSQVSGVAERTIDQDVNDIIIDDALNSTDVSIAVQANVGYLSREDALNPGTTVEAHASVVAGVSEREVETNELSQELTVSDVTLAGVAERIITVDAGIDLPDDVSKVTGLAEREVVIQSGVEQAQSSATTGVAERIVENNNITLQVIAQQSSVDAQANITYESREDALNLGSTLETDASSIDGTSESVKIGDGVLTTGSVTVTGEAERIVKLPVVGSGDLTADEVGVAAVTGVGERVVVTADGTPQSQASVVDALSERTIVGVNTDLVAGEISVASIEGDAEREVFQLLPPGEGEGWRPNEYNLVTGEGEVKKVGSGELDTTSSIVACGAERIIEQEDGGVFRPTEYNVVTGVAENKILGQGTLDGLDDHIVVGAAERVITVDAGFERTEENLVTGLAERIVVLEEGINGPDDESVVDGLAERIITASGDLVDGESTVAGVAERIITVDAGIEQTDESVVSGTVERIITVDEGIVMPDDDSKVVATAERIITVDAGIDMPDDDSKVTGTSERTITVDQGIEQGDVSKVVADAERIVPSETGAPRAVLSYVSGVAERTVNSVSGIAQVQSSTVNGTVEREIDQEGGGVFKPTDNNVIAGVAERVITVDAGIDMPDDDSKVTGTSERVVVLQDGIRHFHDATVSGEGIRAAVIVRDTVEADESTVAGIAERTIVQEGDAEFKPTDNNLVEGTAEREIRTSADLVTDGNRVIGTSERISVSIFSDLQTGSSVVTHDPDPITIVRHPIGGLEYPEYRSDLEAHSSLTPTVSERKIVQETDGLSTELKFAPNPSDPNIFYPNDGKTLILSGNADPANDGVYDLLDRGYTVAVYSGTSLIVSENEDYNVYYRKVGYKDYRLVIFRTTNLTWVAFQTSINPELEIYTDLIYSGAQSSAELIASTSASRGGPYKIMKPTDYNVVSGTAERELNANLDVSVYDDESIVTGVATRVLRPITGATSDTESIVSGIGERLLNNDGLGQQVYAGPSTVQGSADRHSVATGDLVTGESTVTGLGENSIDFISGVEQVDDATVTATVERTVVGISASTEAGSSEVETEIEISSIGSGVLEAQSSTVNGLGVRTSVSEDATLQAGTAQIVATDDRTVIGVPGKVDPKASDSTVTATTKRTVKISGDIQAPDHIVDAEIERKISGSGSEQTEDHIVDGVAERVITAVGVLEADECSVTGEANKAMHVVQGIAQVSSSVVHGVAERSITISADLVSTDSKVDARVYTNNIEQQAMHVQIKFRIRKEPVRRIIVRQTPTNRV